MNTSSHPAKLIAAALTLAALGSAPTVASAAPSQAGWALAGAEAARDEVGAGAAVEDIGPPDAPHCPWPKGMWPCWP